MTTGKTIPLTLWTFVGKVMSLIFNMLSKVVIAINMNGAYKIQNTPPPQKKKVRSKIWVTMNNCFENYFETRHEPLYGFTFPIYKME